MKQLLSTFQLYFTLIFIHAIWIRTAKFRYQLHDINISTSYHRMPRTLPIKITNLVTAYQSLWLSRYYSVSIVHSSYTTYLFYQLQRSILLPIKYSGLIHAHTTSYPNAHSATYHLLLIIKDHDFLQRVIYHFG